MATYEVEMFNVNANGETINSTKTNVDGSGFVSIIDHMTATYGASVSTFSHIENALDFASTIWFPISGDAQPGVRVQNQSIDFLRQLYADFRKEACGRCGGSGVWGASYENGRPVGGGICFRCRGAGKVTHFQNELGAVGMALSGSGLHMSYEEFCREYRSSERVSPVIYCESCSIAPVSGSRFCEDCSERLVADFEADALADAPDFVLDDGTYTLVYADDLDGSGQYFTFRVRTAKTGRLEGKRLVEYLSGPDNSLDFQAFAFVNTSTINVWKKFERGHLVNRAREIEAVARNDRDALEAAGLLYAERSSRCRRCNKVLTVPTSLAAGYGPDCAAILGIAYGSTRSSERVSDIPVPRHEAETLSASLLTNDELEAYIRALGDGTYREGFSLISDAHMIERQRRIDNGRYALSSVDSILSPEYLASLSDDELDDRIDAVTRSAARGEDYPAIVDAFEGERQRRIEERHDPLSQESNTVVEPDDLVSWWQNMDPATKKEALRQINAGYQEEFNRVNRTTGIVY